MSDGRLPPRDLPGPTMARLEELGGRPINLYRALAANPEMLDAWVEFAWALRGATETSRALRELVILRVAQLTGSEYQWSSHVVMARAAGVGEAAIAALDGWREADAYDDRQRAALAVVDGMHGGEVDDAAFAELRSRFTDAEIVEVLLTASAYLGLATLLDALRVPTDS